MRLVMIPISMALAVALMTSCAGGSPATSQAAGGLGAGEGAVESAMSQTMKPPLQISLSGSSLPGNRAALDVEVLVSGSLAVPPVLRIEIPQGTVLEEGLAREVLSASGRAASYKRVFVVKGDGPVQVVVESVGPGIGAHASARWPVDVRGVELGGPVMEPIPSAVVDGVTVDEAVPLQRQ